MGLKDYFGTEYYKPIKEQSDLFKDWNNNKRITLVRLILEDLSKYTDKPKKIIIDRDAYIILNHPYYEKLEGIATVLGHPVELTYDNLPSYYKLEW